MMDTAIQINKKQKVGLEMDDDHPTFLVQMIGFKPSFLVQMVDLVGSLFSSKPPEKRCAGCQIGFDIFFQKL